MSFRLFVICFVALFFLAAANEIHVDLKRPLKHGFALVDNQGRTRLFHGVNAVYKVSPYLPDINGFTADTTLSQTDAKQLREWGMNFVRLGVMWPGVMPTRDNYDTSYLSKARAMIEMLADNGIYTLVDLHQDLGGRMLCGEGFPDWAVLPGKAARPFPFPVLLHNMSVDEKGYPKLEECLQKSFGEYYMTEAVNAAFQALYDNDQGIRDQFVKFWAKVVQTFKGVRGILGYELINEPLGADFYHHPTYILPGKADKLNLYPMYMAAAEEMRKADPDCVIFFEKSIQNAIGPIGFPTVPGGDEYRDRSVYSWHNYCGTVDRSGNPRWYLVCEGEQAAQFEDGLVDIDTMKCGSFITEFGAVAENSTKSIEDLDWVLYHADKNIQSWAYWQYKSFKDFTTASNSAESLYYSDGTVQTHKVEALSRVYAPYIAGTPSEHMYDRKQKTFTLKYAAVKPSSGPAETEIWVWPITKDTQSQIKINVLPETVSYKLSDDRRTLVISHGSDVQDGTQISVSVAPSN